MSVSPNHRRGVSLLELMFSISFFLVLSIIAVLSLRQITGIWTRTSERDLALRQLLRADRFLQSDLANSAAGSGQSVFQLVQAGSGTVMTGHALALLLPSQQQGQLTVTSGGLPVLDRLVTYYLAVPQNVQALTGLSYNYTAGGNGHEDYCPYKWLVRKDTAGPAPPDSYNLPSIPNGWLGSGVIEVPGQLWNEADRKVVATNLHQFRVIQGPPTWTVELCAIAVGDARRKLAMGNVALSTTRYAITHRISLLARN